MIKIIVELHPYGDESRKQVLSEAKIWNDGTGTKTRGNYKFQILTQGSSGIWKSGSLANFPRKQKNVWYLLFLCLNSILKDK